LKVQIWASQNFSAEFRHLMKLLQLAQQEIKLEKNVAFFEVSLGGTLCYFTFKKCLNP